MGHAQMLYFNHQLFLWPQLIPHIEYSLLQKSGFGFTAYLRDNTLGISYEGQSWREIINVCGTSCKVSVILARF